MKTKLFNFIYESLFRLYLHLIKYGYCKHSESRVYDHYDMIDTLGWDADNTRFTWSYSEELGCVHAIKLPFHYSIELVNYEGKEIRLHKTPYFHNDFQY
jgi:hypothetical protein